MTQLNDAVAFIGTRRIAFGPLVDVAAAAKTESAGDDAPLLIFDAETSRPIELDLRGALDDVLARLALPDAADVARGRGRPKLGVVAREITLLPRHWDWLAAQRGGASAAIRRLVDGARQTGGAANERKLGQESLYRFITAMAGDAPGYEEATRALFAGDAPRFAALVHAWPADVAAHALTLAGAAFGLTRTPLDDLIAEPRRAAAQRALAAAFPGEAVQAAEPTAWGASGAGVFKLTVGGRAAILRLDGPPDGLRDPARQYACIRIAAEVGAAPALLHADVGDRVSISVFIAAALADPPLTRAGQIVAVTETLRRLHAAPLFPRLISYFDAMDGLLAQFAAAGILPEGALDEPLALYARIAGVYPRDPNLVSSHNDLNPSNVIFQGARAWILDWESAFAADRFVDLAAIANFFAADEDEEALVLRGYFGGAVDEAVQARLFLMQQVNRLFYAAMLLSAAAAERPGLSVTAEELAAPRFAAVRGEMATLATYEGRRRFGCVFLGEALHQMRSARFEAALAQLS